MSTSAVTEVKTRLFLGVALPVNARTAIQKALPSYREHVATFVPEENWHITFVFLGDVQDDAQYIEALRENLAHPFRAAISLTHIGRGLKEDQLWVYANPTPVIQALQKRIQERVASLGFPTSHEQEFVPHTKVANLYKVNSSFGLPDVPISYTFPVNEINLYQSHQIPHGVKYTIAASIPVNN